MSRSGATSCLFQLLWSGSGLSLSLYLFKLSKVSAKSLISDSSFFCSNDHVVDVDLDVLSYLTFEAVLHHPLVGCSCVS
jgi:hypothetical protein